MSDLLYFAGRYTHVMQPATAPCMSDESALLNGVRSEERTHHSWMDVCRRLCSLAEKEVNVTEKWCRCNVSRLNGLSALCLSRCSCLRTLLTSKGPANLQNADKEWALVMLTVYSFVKLAFISTNSHMRDVTIRHFEGVVRRSQRRERGPVRSRG